jgi:uncharacterized membrane protein
MRYIGMMTAQAPQARPRPASSWLPETFVEWMIEGISVAALSFAIFILIDAWPRLPAVAPSHFDFAGKPDAWGAKMNLWVLPFVGTVVYLMLTVVGRIPHTHNFTVNVTPENAPRLYRLSRMLVAWMKAQIACTLSYISWRQVQVSMGDAQGLGWAFVPVTLIAIGMTIFIYRRMSLREQA